MTFFRKNTWGPSSEIDYKKLNSMAQNDLAIKEILDRAAKGVIMWKTAGAIDISKLRLETPPSPNIDQVWRILPEYQDIEFPVGKDRFLNFVFHPGLMAVEYIDPPTLSGSNQIAEVQFTFALDGEILTTTYINIYGPTNLGRDNASISFTTYSPTVSSDIAEGNHRISVAYKILDEGNFGVNVKMDQSFLYVEDLGRREV